MEVPVGCQGSDEVAVDAASGVIDELFYFQLVGGHNISDPFSISVHFTISLDESEIV